ncbi:MAG: hypothetical protein ACOCRX_04115 [Candidatus Woesearchaeota archaeon]
MIINEKTFPREVGVPRKVIENKENFFKFVNNYNGYKKAIYSSVYSFNKILDNKPEYDSAIIDSLFFDFDDKDCNAYEEAKKLHDFCLKHNIKHRLIMSGGGYHIYIYTKRYQSQNTRETIYNAQHYFIDYLNLKVDTHIVGNPAQLARVPNTYNLKREKFCIPVNKEQFDKGDNFIKELANKQNFCSGIIEGDEIDLKKFDYEPKPTFEDIGDLDIDVDVKEINENFPPCIKQIMNKVNLRWKERYLLIMYLREKGYSEKNAFELISKVCNERSLRHCINEERQLQYLYRRTDLFFPTCEKIKLDGLCPGKCSQYNKVVYK